MQIEVTTLELRVGDVWNGKKLIAITPPTPPLSEAGTRWLYFEGLGYPLPFSVDAVFLVRRSVENVLIG